DYGGDGVDYSPHFLHSDDFPSFDAAVTWATETAIRHGFLLVIASYAPQRDGRSDRYLRCDCRVPKSPRDFSGAVRLNTKRKGVGCKFVIKVVERKDRSGFFIAVKAGEHGKHNHELVVYPEGHRQISGLSLELKQLVREMSDAQTKPAQIDNPTVRHVYNYRDKIRQERLDGRHPTQQVLHELSAIVTDCDLGLTKALAQVFPQTSHLLCTRHINKDVADRVQKLYGASTSKTGETLRTECGDWSSMQPHRRMIGERVVPGVDEADQDWLHFESLCEELRCRDRSFVRGASRFIQSQLQPEDSRPGTRRHAEKRLHGSTPSRGKAEVKVVVGVGVWMREDEVHPLQVVVSVPPLVKHVLWISGEMETDELPYRHLQPAIIKHHCRVE
ncbi:hypothetical protein RDABS01_034596, partial [Bienertia sinuspersici]